MKIAVTEKAIRDYVNEMMMGSGVSDSVRSPVNISSTVDPSAAATEPMNDKFKPQNRTELKSALSQLIDQISDDESPDVFMKMKDFLKNKKENEMNKQEKVAESFIRSAVRKMLDEAGKKKEKDPLNINDLPPVKKIPFGVHGSEFMRRTEKNKSNLQRIMNKSTLGDEEEREYPEAPAPGRERKNVMQTDVSGASFKDIAKEFGFASESGAKAAVERAMKKAKFLSSMDPDDLEILTLTAIGDYIEVLKNTGELTDADVRLLKDHPQIISTLDGFREYFDKEIKRAQGGSEV